MRITLIKPNMGEMLNGNIYIDEGRMEPLQLGVIAGKTPKSYSIKMYDDRMEHIKYDEPTDLVAITVETFTAKRSYEIASEYMKRGVQVILGGMHPTLLPKEAMHYADCIVTGDMEDVWLQILDDKKANNLKTLYKGGVTGEVQAGFITRRDIFNKKGYLPISLLQFSRGCNNSCEFCATSVYSKKQHRCRDIDLVVKEIKTIKRKLLFFVDDNIVANPFKAKELFKALIPLKIKWVSQASLSMTNDPELMELMMKSGCLGNVIGFESINVDNMININKEPNIDSFDQYKKEIKILKKYGMQIWAAFTLGYDLDTKKTIEDTVNFAIKNKFAFAAFNILMPYPSTKLYEKLKAEDRLLYDDKWWLHDYYRFNHASFVPKKITADELTDCCFAARKKFNSFSSIILRAFDFKTNMRTPYKFITYLIYNPLFRKEVYKKQSMKLGLKEEN